jgi:hypothetical protein
VQTDIPRAAQVSLPASSSSPITTRAFHVFIPFALQNIQALQWQLGDLHPLVDVRAQQSHLFSQQAGRDPFMKDTKEAIAAARAINLNVAFFPQPRFAECRRLLERRAARFATGGTRGSTITAPSPSILRIWPPSPARRLSSSAATGSPRLSLQGRLQMAAPSGVPADAEARWITIIAEVRQHFSGNVLFALPYTTRSSRRRPIFLGRGWPLSALVR